MTCSRYLKFLIYFTTSIIFLTGVGILALGIRMTVDSGPILRFLEKLPDAPSEMSQMNVGYLLIAVGSLLVVSGFLGGCGAFWKNKFMLIIFFITVMLLMMALFAGAILLTLFRPLVDNVLVKFGIVAVQSLKTDYGKIPETTVLWDNTMATLECCGFSNYTDFIDSSYHQTNGYPFLCCEDGGAPCGNTTSTAVPTLPGCFSRMQVLIEESSLIIIGVAVGIGALELMSMSISMSLFCRFKSVY